MKRDQNFDFGTHMEKLNWTSRTDLSGKSPSCIFFGTPCIQSISDRLIFDILFLLSNFLYKIQEPFVLCATSIFNISPHLNRSFIRCSGSLKTAVTPFVPKVDFFLFSLPTKYCKTINSFQNLQQSSLYNFPKDDSNHEIQTRK